MRIVHAAAEVEPWCKTGGLADVVGSLPQALAELTPPGSRVLVLCPLHRGVRAAAERRGETLVDAGWTVAPVPGGPVGRVLRVEPVSVEGLEVAFVDCPELFDREGIYHGADQQAWPDNPQRFAWFAKAVIDVSPALLGGAPDVLHAHDWHLGLAPVYARQFGGAEVRRAWESTRVIFTIHNILYQGVYSKELVPRLGLRWEQFTMEGFEYRDQLSFLKAGIAFSDVTTTVSPGHARECLTEEGGHGLDGFLRARGDQFCGVLNGLSPAMWDPGIDPTLPAPYWAENMAGRATCRTALLEEMGLPDLGGLVFGVVSRLVWNKGLDVVADAWEHLADERTQLVLLGSGERAIEERFEELARRVPGRVAVRIGFDAGLARRIFAGSDVIGVPSRVEPCGLTQLQAMRYGAVPIAHPVGGLADTVIDPGDQALGEGHGTGFVFSPLGGPELARCIDRAAHLHAQPEQWNRLVQTCMSHDSSWTVPATRTLGLYTGKAAP
ncbi:MAG: glycogen synthase GlgA [Deltaproteobacteria bacterium]|nr:glycogen synthase GlgA [Deltaproteobacteria bacterium]